MRADGARSEFNAQTQITTYFTDDPFYNVHLKVPIINGKPLVRIQDQKHAKKTARKSTIYWSKASFIRNRYRAIRSTFSISINHVLLKRDVIINVDKQDDGAAYRIFHSETLTIFLLIGPLIIPRNSQGKRTKINKVNTVTTYTRVKERPDVFRVENETTLRAADSKREVIDNLIQAFAGANIPLEKINHLASYLTEGGAIP
ncbi:hypothetical protein RhiirA5_412324 [Rhizophagus irregularis]|uniref:Uncharacterized protein n=1 Tax=Rhizophagus irregularis TaxID=588596 RepID=A0A2I1EN69_9GLOM|nr:hypothetical protein RhiirA5_412324 [Rhizophagus irregularis]PKY23574.1 hypothetical protein RhiirB3_437828 [Rhizophagus irregularis]